MSSEGGRWAGREEGSEVRRRSLVAVESRGVVGKEKEGPDMWGLHVSGTRWKGKGAVQLGLGWSVANGPKAGRIGPHRVEWCAGS